MGKGSEKSDEAEDWNTNRSSRRANMAKIDRESVSGVTLENCCRQAGKINFPLYCRLPEDGHHSSRHVAEVYIHNLQFYTCFVHLLVFVTTGRVHGMNNVKCIVYL